MIRIHIDDLKHMMKHDHFAYLKRWLEKHGAVIVTPDDVRIADRAMLGTFTTRPGKFGEDEPYPPYGGYRRQLEEARDRPPKV